MTPLVLAVHSLLLAAALPAQALAPAPTAGAPGLGDRYYPALGNGGYDALHYDVELAIDVSSGNVEAACAMRARATQALSAFHLDFLGPQVKGVEIDGAPASFVREEGELIITPAQALAEGQEFQARVLYSGQPSRVVDPGVPFIPQGIGWVRLDDGTIVVMSEPSGARGWVPCNDHPLDKATWTFTLEVDEPWVAAANGLLKERTTTENRTRSRFEMDDPMASYLATVCVGRFEVERSEGPGGLPLTHYFPEAKEEKDRQRLRKGFARTSEQLAFFSELFGPYPFDCFGGVLINDSLGGALETQTLVVYTGGASDSTVAHELAHHWFGDSVSPAAWEHLWLSEGFATYAEWLWREHDKGREAYEKRVAGAYGFVRKLGPPGETGPVIFGPSVYQRGAWTLHALRTELGDETFFRALRTWIERRSGGVGTTDDFRALCEEVSGKDLKAFFQAWIYDQQCPLVPQYEEQQKEKAEAAPAKPGKG